MSVRYLFPCPSCHQDIELAPKRAGQDVECPGCQQVSEAPKLGVLRQLPSIGESVKSGQSQTKRFLFSAGLALAVLVGFAGGILYLYSTSMIYEMDWDAHHAEWNAYVDSLNGAEALKQWTELDVESGLGEWYEQNLARYRTQGTYLLYLAYGLLGIAASGLVMLLSSFFVKK